MASKDRTELFLDPVRLSEETGAMLLQWLESGKDPAAMAAEEVDEAIQIMQGCETLGDLQGVFGGAYRRCSETLRPKLKTAYDKRKAELERADQSEGKAA